MRKKEICHIPKIVQKRKTSGSVSEKLYDWKIDHIDKTLSRARRRPRHKYTKFKSVLLRWQLYESPYDEVRQSRAESKKSFDCKRTDNQSSVYVIF